ncbi:MAG TPA: hypothetical protein DEB47_18270 [Citreicella sp.]|nr:hypothetical protein [Citreicella sp.]
MRQRPGHRRVSRPSPCHSRCRVSASRPARPGPRPASCPARRRTPRGGADCPRPSSDQQPRRDAACWRRPTNLSEPARCS